MFLKTSISTTKKLIQKTLYNVKYLFSGGGGGGGYEKIPKTYTQQKRIIIMSSPPPTKEDQVSKRKEIIMYDGIKKKYEEKRIRDERSYLVAQKLNELKMLENYKDEHALDIEQVLYYYSRLTCPAYVEIVDNFFMQIYSELFGASIVN
ncbi:uncharacterized protein LOC125876922 [Solanum stenotomum]|uniref:uncharacterized protein LOC125876922 n=1 Tax=Solanum stenotomum TaxID=172797 RepID=UPI0020D091D2|nr:uncharacterized protein LOC125876922 [Solanum stenotomum]